MHYTPYRQDKSPPLATIPPFFGNLVPGVHIVRKDLENAPADSSHHYYPAAKSEKSTHIASKTSAKENVDRNHLI
jgi:hypothetical protein